MTFSKTRRLAVLISGRGSNLKSIEEACRTGSVRAKICLVISNDSKAKGLFLAKKAGLRTMCIENQNYKTRESFDEALVKTLHQAKAEIVVLAGFMRILTSIFVKPYLGKLINIHPSLLPKFRGLNTHQRALDAGEHEAGATVHFVTEELDSGPIIIQGRVPIYEDDTSDLLATRVLAKEHQIYPLGLSLLVEGRLKLEDSKAILDGEILPEQGIFHE